MKLMKPLLVSTLLGGAALLVRAADVPALKADNKPDLAAQLLKVERDWNEALKQHDKTMLTAMCSDDCALTDQNGKITDKTQYVRDALNVNIISYTLSGLKAHVYGEMGIVTGQWSGTVKTEEQEANVTLHFTDTFVRRNQRWFAVASQATNLVGDDAAP